MPLTPSLIEGLPSDKTAMAYLWLEPVIKPMLLIHQTCSAPGKPAILVRDSGVAGGPSRYSPGLVVLHRAHQSQLVAPARGGQQTGVGQRSQEETWSCAVT